MLSAWQPACIRGKLNRAFLKALQVVENLRAVEFFHDFRSGVVLREPSYTALPALEVCSADGA